MKTPINIVYGVEDAAAGVTLPGSPARRLASIILIFPFGSRARGR
jgi:hypothetical protein